MYCQVVHICGCIPARIQHALADLPDTLDETYQRTLREIKNLDWEFAHRLFQFVAVASRPLRVEELADLLAFDFKAGSFSKFHEDWRLEDPDDAVLSTCSTLLSVVDGSIVQFSHFSVKEFLTSARLAGASDIVSRRYHISMTSAHTLAAQASLGLLLHMDKDIVTRDGLQELPLAKYAAQHWADHARLEDVSQIVEDGMKQLFDPSKPHLAVCIWVHDSEVLSEGNPRFERPLPLCNAPLYYATFWGLQTIVKFLVVEHLQDVHLRGSSSFISNATPLHLASQKGHAKVARFLLECDADVTAQDSEGMTPLHLASWEGQREIVSMLIERGADMAARNKDGDTPLHLASKQGKLDVASMLIELGVDVTARNKVGETPLHLASRHGELEVAGMLIERGADMTAQNFIWETPLHVASVVGNLKAAGMLIDRGADVSAQNQDGVTPLHLALWYGKAEVAGMLIERGADTTAQSKYWGTPLHLASQRGELEVVRMLIGHGADVTAQDDDGLTPLHLASTRLLSMRRPPQMYAEIARILLEHGADRAAQDEDGRTPFGLALSKLGIAKVAHVLRQHGTNPGTHKNRS